MKYFKIENKFLKTFIFVISIFLLVTLFVAAYIYFRLPNYEPKVSIVEIYSVNLDERIFIKKKVWGITGDHQIIVISNSSEQIFEPIIDKEYIFEGLSPFFYNFRNDTLNVYIGKKSRDPIDMITKIKINQIVLTNPEMMNLFDNYKEKSLSKF